MSVALSLASRSAKRENCDNTRKTDWHQYGHFGTTDGTVFRAFLGEAPGSEIAVVKFRILQVAEILVPAVSHVGRRAWHCRKPDKIQKFIEDELHRCSFDGDVRIVRYTRTPANKAGNQSR